MNYTDIYVDGVKLQTPSTFQVGHEDLDAEGIRPITTGILKRNRIRSRVAKYELTWLLKDMPNIKEIEEMLLPETVNVRTYDSLLGKETTKKMYCAKTGYTYKRTLSGIKAEGFKANLVEV